MEIQNFILSILQSVISSVFTDCINGRPQYEKYKYDQDNQAVAYRQRKTEKLSSARREAVTLIAEIKNEMSRTQCVSLSHIVKCYKDVHKRNDKTNKNIAELSGIMNELGEWRTFEKIKTEIDNVQNYQREFYTKLDRGEKLDFYSSEWRRMFEISGEIERDCEQLIFEIKSIGLAE